MFSEIFRWCGIYFEINALLYGAVRKNTSQSPSVTAPSVREPNELELELSKAAFGDWGPECCREWDERLHRGRRNQLFQCADQSMNPHCPKAKTEQCISSKK